MDKENIGLAKKFVRVFCVLLQKTQYMHNGMLFSHKKKEILPFATTCINLEDTMLSEISQTQQDKYHLVPLTCGIKKKLNCQVWQESLMVLHLWVCAESRGCPLLLILPLFQHNRTHILNWAQSCLKKRLYIPFSLVTRCGQGANFCPRV